MPGEMKVLVSDDGVGYKEIGIVKMISGYGIKINF